MEHHTVVAGYVPSFRLPHQVSNIKICHTHTPIHQSKVFNQLGARHVARNISHTETKSNRLSLIYFRIITVFNHIHPSTIWQVDVSDLEFSLCRRFTHFLVLESIYHLYKYRQSCSDSINKLTIVLSINYQTRIQKNGCFGSHLRVLWLLLQQFQIKEKAQAIPGNTKLIN